MKSLLLEMVFVAQALLFWAFALPVAAVLFVLATAWQKVAAFILGEPLTPPTARMSRAAA